jgi:hypothetical protein
MSALPSNADMCSELGDVRFVPEADSRALSPALVELRRTARAVVRYSSHSRRASHASWANRESASPKSNVFARALGTSCGLQIKIVTFTTSLKAAPPSASASLKFSMTILVWAEKCWQYRACRVCRHLTRTKHKFTSALRNDDVRIICKWLMSAHRRLSCQCCHVSPHWAC